MGHPAKVVADFGPGATRRDVLLSDSALSLVGASSHPAPRLPHAVPSATSRRASHLPRVRPPMPVPHVLLVDDELAVLRVLDRALTRRGLRVSVAPDAATARAIVARETVHALVLDYRLPLIRGDALLAQLAEIDPSLRGRAVFMTGDISPAVDATLAATGCPCVAKPFELQDIARRIDDLLAGSPTHAAAVPAA